MQINIYNPTWIYYTQDRIFEGSHDPTSSELLIHQSMQWLAYTIFIYPPKQIPHDVQEMLI